jgi:hypothetical protein
METLTLKATEANMCQDRGKMLPPGLAKGAFHFPCLFFSVVLCESSVFSVLLNLNA